MAKKTTPAKKAASTKKAAFTRKAASTRKPASTKKAASVKAAAPASLAPAASHEKNIPLFPPQQVAGIKTALNGIIHDFKTMADDRLTALQRRRKIGPGTRNYGFVDKVSDLADSNPDYAHFFSISDLKNCIRNVENCRDLVILLTAFARLVTNTLMIYSDDAYGMASNYYHMVKEMSGRGDAEAMELYRDLKTTFKKAKRASSEPTEKQALKDANAFIHGTKDGLLLIENVKPKLEGGKRRIIDEKLSGSKRFKESGEGELDE
ncbi:MAG: hypothetical protein LBH43_05360 [Treponema sp.]|jgi:hypothetical protein|nr:hypothetical protein [Treponema sp.]